jgi:hypothetical protein
MSTTRTAAAGLGLTTILGLGLAAPAAASVDSTADTIAQLEAQGHHVQLNGSTSVPLSQCTVTGVHGLNDSNLDESGNKLNPDLHGTVYVDVVCHNP